MPGTRHPANYVWFTAAVMFVIASVLNPDYTAVLWKTTAGMTLLCIALGLMLMGLFVIKKITTVRV